MLNSKLIYTFFNTEHIFKKKKKTPRKIINKPTSVFTLTNYKPIEN